jgi:NAD(P)H-nitrite reductase large subunit
LLLCREKLVKLDSERRKYDIVVIGEEPHIAYNRVGLSSYFEHRKIEDLYLNPKEWVGSLMFRTGFKANDIQICDYSMALLKIDLSITISTPG